MEPIASYADSSNPPVIFEDDFLEHGFSATADTGDGAGAPWFITLGGTSDTIGIADDAPGGWVKFLTGTSDDDECSMQLNGESFKLQAGKPLTFRAHNFKVTDADKTAFFLGLSIACVDTLDANAIKDASMTDFVGFLWDGTDLFAVAGKNATAIAWTESAYIAKRDTGLGMVDDTFVNLVFKFDGEGNIRFYVDGYLVATVTDTASTKTLIPDDEAVSPIIGVQTIAASGAQTAYLDRLYIRQDR